MDNGPVPGLSFELAVVPKGLAGLVAGALLLACSGSSTGEDGGAPVDAGAVDAGPDGGPAADAGAADAGGDARGFTGLYVGAWTETFLNRLDGGQFSDAGTASVSISYLSTDEVTVTTDCGCDHPCELPGVTQDATSFTLALDQPVWCMSGECAKTTITGGSGRLDGGVLTLELQGVHDSPAVDECELTDLLYQRTFVGNLTCDGGCP